MEQKKKFNFPILDQSGQTIFGPGLDQNFLGPGPDRPFVDPTGLDFVYWLYMWHSNLEKK